MREEAGSGAGPLAVAVAVAVERVGLGGEQHVCENLEMSVHVTVGDCDPDGVVVLPQF